MSTKQVLAQPELRTSLDDIDAPSWVLEGIAAGVLGAFVIALFFLIWDSMAGHPLATPNALGAAFFLGERVAPSAPIQPALVLGYTIMHGTLFVALGVIAAFEVMTGTRLRHAPRRRILVLTGLLFLGFEVLFAVFGQLFLPDLLAELGAGRVTFANLLAASAMAGLLEYRTPAPDSSTSAGSS